MELFVVTLCSATHGRVAEETRSVVKTPCRRKARHHRARRPPNLHRHRDRVPRRWCQMESS